MPVSSASVADYDGRWKDALERFLRPFLELLWPAVAVQVDWTHAPTFLDKELQRIGGSAPRGRRFVDKLVRVRDLAGADRWLLIHVEVQARANARFARRMFQYWYRLRDGHATARLNSMAVLTADGRGSRPGEYVECEGENHVRYRFPMVDLLDWQTRAGELERMAGHNPFAVVVLAQLASREPAQARLRRKTQLVRLLYAHGFASHDVLALLTFIDGIMVLPSDLEPLFGQALAALEKEYDVAYVTSIERMAIERGLQKGMEQGLQQGIEQGIEQGIQKGIQKGIQQGVQQGMQRGLREGLRKGRQETLAGALSDLIRHKFGELPDPAALRIAQATDDDLRTWLVRVLDAGSVEDVFT